MPGCLTRNKTPCMFCPPQSSMSEYATSTIFPTGSSSAGQNVACRVSCLGRPKANRLINRMGALSRTREHNQVHHEGGIGTLRAKHPPVTNSRAALRISQSRDGVGVTDPDALCWAAFRTLSEWV